MSINKEILEKYAEGKCSPEEQLLIEDWLNSNEAVNAQLPQKEMQISGDRIWKAIVADQSRSRIKTARYAIMAAASILLIATITIALYLKEEKHTYPKFSSVLHEGDVQNGGEAAGLRFILTKNSKAKIKSTDGSEIEVVFCGTMEVKNTSKRDASYVFESACKNSSYTKKEILIKAGKTYVVLHNFYKKDEILILNKANLEGLPDAVTATIRRDLSI